eukprot:3410490-Rhodomonas_salina.2
MPRRESEKSDRFLRQVVVQKASLCVVTDGDVETSDQNQTDGEVRRSRERYSAVAAMRKRKSQCMFFHHSLRDFAM